MILIIVTQITLFHPYFLYPRSSDRDASLRALWPFCRTCSNVIQVYSQFAMPLDNSLPDEIISEILSPALTVVDEVFSVTYRVSPFSNYSESTSAYLAVCKSWLRVATPLLYNVVILRSKAQAKALARALSRNTDLGRFIKKLRVGGGYGAPMHDVLKYSPNVSDLYLSLDIFSSDNTDGLCKGLHLIDPTRLILQCERTASNKMFVKLRNALAEAIPKWSHLVRLRRLLFF